MKSLPSQTKFLFLHSRFTGNEQWCGYSPRMHFEVTKLSALLGYDAKSSCDVFCGNGLANHKLLWKCWWNQRKPLYLHQKICPLGKNHPNLLQTIQHCLYPWIDQGRSIWFTLSDTNTDAYAMNDANFKPVLLIECIDANCIVTQGRSYALHSFTDNKLIKVFNIFKDGFCSLNLPGSLGASSTT